MIPLSKTKAKYIKSLQLKKNRDAENRFLVEGKKTVLEFLKSSFQPVILVGTEEFYRENKLPREKAEVLLSRAKEISAIGTLKTNDSVIAVFEKQEMPVSIDGEAGIILALDGINDPGNLGTFAAVSESQETCGSGSGEIQGNTCQATGGAHVLPGH